MPFSNVLVWNKCWNLACWFVVMTIVNHKHSQCNTGNKKKVMSISPIVIIICPVAGCGCAVVARLPPHVSVWCQCPSWKLEKYSFVYSVLVKSTWQSPSVFRSDDSRCSLAWKLASVMHILILLGELFTLAIDFSLRRSLPSNVMSLPSWTYCQ